MLDQETTRISSKAGLPPGVLMHVGEKKSNQVRLSIMDYTADDITEKVLDQPEQCAEYLNHDSVSWVNVDGLHDVDFIARVGEVFDLHPLLVEDVLNTNHRPKTEDFDDYLFITLKMLGVKPSREGIASEQVSFVLGKSWVLSFQEQQGDIFDGLRERMQDPKLRIRQRGPDYLFYRLVDTVIDHYFHVLDHYVDAVEDLEERVLQKYDEELIMEIQAMKKELVVFRKAIYPLRDAMSELVLEPTDLFDEGTQRYLMDATQHLLHLAEAVDTQREMIAGIMDLYMSGASNRMNQIMKVLTVMASIFIPLTFIAGVYGMNFDNMPELHWKYGYLAVWVIMAGTLAVMIFYFKKKKWW